MPPGCPSRWPLRQPAARTTRYLLLRRVVRSLVSSSPFTTGDSPAGRSDHSCQMLVQLSYSFTCS
eukprot:scaffold13390_cov116-Isochrysis_galbana.AAC.2